MSDTATKVKAIIVDKLGVDKAEVTPDESVTPPTCQVWMILSQVMAI